MSETIGDSSEGPKISRKQFLASMLGIPFGLKYAFRGLFLESNIASTEIQSFCLNHPISKGDEKRHNILMTYDDWPKNPEQLQSYSFPFSWW